tara:strand:- start:5746 stop:7992 length:2247 start_codon:yes stop_codon:yes gene_type:complete
MAEKIISPGVFTKEIDQTFLPAAVGEIGAAIVGPTVKGPVLVPTTVNSFDEYQSTFGSTFVSGSTKQSYLTSVAAQQYLKSGNQLTVVRVAPSGYANATASISTDGDTTTATYATGTLIISGAGLQGQEFSIGSTDFSFVGTGSGLTNTTTQVFVSSGSTMTQTLQNVSNAIASSSIHGLQLSASFELAAATKHAGLVHISASNKGANNYSGSTSDFSKLYYGQPGAPTSGSLFATGGDSTNPIGGGSDGTSGNSFVLRTISDGAIMNSQTASKGHTNNLGSKNLLKSGSADNLRWEISTRNLKKGTFTLLIRRGDDKEDRKQILETWTNLSIDPNEPNYYAKVIGNQKRNIAQPDSADPYIQLSGSYVNNSKYVYVAEETAASANFLDAAGNVRVSQSAAAHGLPAVGSGSAGGAFTGGHDGNGAAGWGSSYGTQFAGEALFFDKITAANSQGLRIDGTEPTQGYNQYITALRLLKNQDEYDINLLLLPGVVDNLHSGVVDKAIEIAEDRQDCFVVVDPVGFGTSTISTVTGRANNRDSNYAAMYWPWVQIRDGQLNKDVWVPPSTVLGGVYSFNDKVAQPWFAPAGLNRGGIDVAIQAERKLTHANRDDLYDANVNPIASFPAQGIVVWGQKTLQQKASALDRVNVRRLLIKVKKFIAASSRFLVFEQNNSATRRRFLNIVNPYLESVQANSGLNAFRVVMDETNNTPDIIDRNIMYGQLFLQPTRTAEFVVLDFTVQPTGASFPE